RRQVCLPERGPAPVRGTRARGGLPHPPDRLGTDEPGQVAAGPVEGGRPAGADELPGADGDLHGDLLQFRLRPVWDARPAGDAAGSAGDLGAAAARQPAVPALLPNRPGRVGVAEPVAMAV